RGPHCNETEGTAMKLNLVTLALAIIVLSFFGMHAAHLPWTAWLHGELQELRLRRRHFFCL
ncbi:MAG: hypothetical protein WBD54_11285, partial [Candidatus Acidiferrales bacterium]